MVTQSRQIFQFGTSSIERDIDRVFECSFVLFTVLAGEFGSPNAIGGTTRTPPGFPNKAGGSSYLCAMRNHTEKIREYYRQATKCAQQADAQMDPKVKQQFLVLARLWLILAGCFELKPRTNLSGKP